MTDIKVISSPATAAVPSTPSSTAAIALLPHTTDRFNGVTVSAHDIAVLWHKLDQNTLPFEVNLLYSLQEWTRAARRGLWITVPGAASALIEVLVRYKFVYHHALGIEATLVVWLPEHRDFFLTVYDRWTGASTVTTSKLSSAATSTAVTTPVVIPASSSSSHRRHSSINPLLTRWAHDPSVTYREGGRVLSRPVPVGGNSAAWLTLRGQHAYTSGRVTVTFELVVTGDHFSVGCVPSSFPTSSQTLLSNKEGGVSFQRNLNEWHIVSGRNDTSTLVRSSKLDDGARIDMILDFDHHHIEFIINGSKVSTVLMKDAGLDDGPLYPACTTHPTGVVIRIHAPNPTPDEVEPALVPPAAVRARAASDHPDTPLLTATSSSSSLVAPAAVSAATVVAASEVKAGGPPPVEAAPASSPTAAAVDVNMIPSYAHTCVGVGGVVLNTRGEILVIQELYSELVNYWKLPGGATDRGEELTTAAVREVTEETGLVTQFVSLLSVRHLQQYRWGCSDLYFLCVMRPVDEKQALQAQAGEVAQVKWMPLLEFLALPNSKRFFAPLYDSLLLDLHSLYPQPRDSFDAKLEAAILGAIARSCHAPLLAAAAGPERPVLPADVVAAPLSPRRANDLYMIHDDTSIAPSGLVPYATPSWDGKRPSALYYTPHRTASRVRLP